MAGYSSITLNVIGAFLILIIGLVLARILGNISKKTIKELEAERILKKINIAVSLERIVPKIIKIIIYFVTLMLVLGQLNISKSIIKNILIVIAILIAFLILLAFKDIVPNFISGVMIKKKKSLKVGEFINILNTKGNIIKITLLETQIKTKEGYNTHTECADKIKWFWHTY